MLATHFPVRVPSHPLGLSAAWVEWVFRRNVTAESGDRDRCIRPSVTRTVDVLLPGLLRVDRRVDVRLVNPRGHFYFALTVPRYPHTYPAALRAPGLWLAMWRPAGASGGVGMWITQIAIRCTVQSL